jgi:NhaP-type Na+/H+ or K+/H+ antiporter
MCSLLCSSDVVAAISLISYDKNPKLFSIVFGEGIINDAVSIIMFQTVMKYTSANATVEWSTPLTIVLDFLSLAFNSVYIGVLFALISSYVLKTFRAFSKNPVYESVMIFCTAYISYVTSESAEYSGIITLLTCGVVMAHYTWYNLSP